MPRSFSNPTNPALAVALALIPPCLAQCTPETLGTLTRPPDHDWSGASIALDGGVAVVGSPWFNTQTGIAYVYRRDQDGAFVPVQELHPHDPSYLAEFGSDVALAGGIMLIAADFWDQWGGEVYAFEQDENGVWTERFKLRTPDPENDQSFADGVALSGQRALVSAEERYGGGGVYVIARAPDSTWSVEDLLVAPDGESVDYFGASISLDGDLAAVGMTNPFENSGGRAFVFARSDAGVWHDEAVLVPPPTPGYECSATRVSIAGGQLLVLAAYTNEEGAEALRAFVYTRDHLGAWTLRDELVPDGIEPGTFFDGVLYHDLAVLSTPFDDRFGENVGAAHAFRPDEDGRWSEFAAFIPEGFEGGRFFGGIEKSSGYRAGIFGFSPEGETTIYNLDLAPCAPGCFADLNLDGTLDLFDFLAFVNAFNAADPAADCDQSGALDLFDFLCFTNAFNAGC